MVLEYRVLGKSGDYIKFVQCPIENQTNEIKSNNVLSRKFNIQQTKTKNKTKQNTPMQKSTRILLIIVAKV